MPCHRVAQRSMFDMPSAGHIEHGNGDDLWFSGGQLVIEADYQLCGARRLIRLHAIVRSR